MIFGKLRVFSFYLDAGQFGASMAQLSSIALVLALGPFKTWKRLLLVITGLVLLYGMIISGTRGALFAFFAAMLVSLIITRNAKVFFIGLAIVAASFVFLKYTSLLNDNAEIRRMRTALKPDDASLNLRLRNQVRLNDYLRTRPFGAGIGALGYAGKTYNKNTYISTIPPDSYWVKVWAMYGIVGLVIWFGIMMYILGKCCGIVWKTKDPKLRFKLAALTAGGAGIFICSYGNEVMNNMPSAMILYISWAFVFLGPKLDKKEVLNY
jgi:O-antigen ligase